MKNIKKRPPAGTDPLLKRQNEGMQDIEDPLTPTDSTLIKQCRQGNTGAFAQLIGRYQGRLFNALLRMVGNYDDAQELSQETFFRALRSLKGFKEKSCFYTWLFRIGMNLAINHHRRSSKVHFTSLQASEDDFGRQADGLRALPDHRNAAPDEQAELNEQYYNACKALVGLDPQSRAVVVLRDIEQLDYATIGRVLEVPPGTVKSRLSRARMALRKVLAEK